MAEESGQSEKQPELVAGKGKKAQVPLEVQEQRLAPKPSIWPIALAFTLVIASVGIMIHPIIFFCGIVLTVLVIIGWILEKK